MEKEKDTQTITQMMELYEQPIRTQPTSDVPEDEVLSRLHMILEETLELIHAAGYDSNIPHVKDISLYPSRYRQPDIVEIADALVDIIVTTKGGYNTWGVDGDALLLREVMPSNFNKAQLVDGKYVLKKVKGKVQKPDGWEPPNVEKELRRQGWNG